ncbi:glucosaminidase domain-containing protein [Marinomonas sp. 5E14-1]|uniref:glucosaminidase domain-containing protein n=1 Tax=Marinomonas sp. 5E14-1 TaxID=3153922 RepID=UPI003267F271
MNKNKTLDVYFVIIILLLIILGVFIHSNEDQESPNSISGVENLGSFEFDEGEATPFEKAYFKSHPIKSDVPDFSTIANIKARKAAFFNFLAQFTYEKNKLTQDDRKRINVLLNKSTMSKRENLWVSTMRKYHKLQPLDTYSKQDLEELLHHVDIIPTSLVLAQAANESAWGTSRFATEGNNFFGQWCFSRGCGLVPTSRDDGADHEVRKFHDARESVFAYIDNLNSNSAYKKLRSIRSSLRENNKAITGLALVYGLEHYSERGYAYIEEIEALINYNKLWRFNKSHPNTKAQ